MISCIICSANTEMREAVRANIAQTIGLPHEIIVIDNQEDQYSICQAYNKGAESAAFETLCFLHEDILFETMDWGQKLLSHFEKHNNTGLIGLAGTMYKTLAPSGWWAVTDKYLSYNYRQSYKHTDKETIERKMNCESVKEVVCLDGVFLAVKKDVFNKFRFDESLPFFHGYDMDLSLAIGAEYKHYVVPDILIDHLSEGSLDDTWIRNMYLLFKKWNKQLPKLINDEPDKKMESLVWQNYCRSTLASTISFGKKMNILFDTGWILSKRTGSFMPAYGFFRSMIYHLSVKLHITKPS